MRVTEFTLVAGLNFAAQVVRHKLHSVADAQNRNAQIENAGIGLIVRFVNVAYRILRHRPFYLSVLHDIVRYYTLSFRKSSDANRIVFFFYRAGSDKSSMRTDFLAT